MTAPVRDAPAIGPKRPGADTHHPAAVDRDMAEGFQDALRRRAGRQDATAVPVRARPRPNGEKGKEADRQTAPSVAPSWTGQAAALPPLRKEEARQSGGDLASSVQQAPGADGGISGAADAAASPPATGEGFDLLMARLDAGRPASARSDVMLSGPDWRADHVTVVQSQDALAVTVDLSQNESHAQETLEELQRRLRARGLRSRVRRAGEGARDTDPATENR